MVDGEIRRKAGFVMTAVVVAGALLGGGYFLLSRGQIDQREEAASSRDAKEPVASILSMQGTTTLTETAYITESSHAVFVTDTLLYAGVGERVATYTFSLTGTLSEVASYQLPESRQAMSIQINDDKMYVVDSHDMMSVLSVSNYLSPTLLGSFSHPISSPHKVAIYGDKAYISELADGSEPKGVRIIDVSTPNSPAEAGLFTMPHKDATRLDVMDRFLLVQKSDPDVGHLAIYDLESDYSTGPALISAYTPVSGTVGAFAAYSPTLFVGVSSRREPMGRIAVVDMTEIDALPEIGSFGLPIDPNVKAPTRVFAADASASELLIADGRRVPYTEDEDELLTTLRLFDTTVPASISEVASIEILAPSRPVEVARSNDVVFVAAGYGGLKVYRIDR